MSAADLSLLAGKHILIVDDDHFVGEDVRLLLQQADVVLVGPARAPDALALIETAEIDAAILDIRLAAERAFRLAERLRDNQIPFVFATAGRDADIPPIYGGFRLTENVRQLAEIARALFAPPIMVG